MHDTYLLTYLHWATLRRQSSLLAAYSSACFLGPKVGGHLAPFLYSSHEPSELSQWLCYMMTAL